MYNKIFQLSLSIIFIISLFFGCTVSDDDSNPPPASTPTPTPAIIPSFDDGPIGFGRDATGGVGGDIMQPTNAVQFRAAVERIEPTIVIIQGTVETGFPTCSANKTIIGIGADATLAGGINMNATTTNVIIRNLTIYSNTDGVAITGATKVWVDHCTFVDCGDGSIDVTKGADMVTVSWCKFIYPSKGDHALSNLIGSSDTDDTPLKTTFYHNWWSDNTIERMPSIRFGDVHVFNNYYNVLGNNYCIRTRIGAEVLVENNFFENVKNPWERYVTKVVGPLGLLKASGNIEVNTTWYVNPDVDLDGNQSFIIPGTDEVFTPPYPYTLEPAGSVKWTVIAGAGAGKITVPSYTPTITFTPTPTPTPTPTSTPTPSPTPTPLANAYQVSSSGVEGWAVYAGEVLPSLAKDSTTLTLSNGKDYEVVPATGTIVIENKIIGDPDDLSNRLLQWKSSAGSNAWRFPAFAAGVTKSTVVIRAKAPTDLIAQIPASFANDERGFEFDLQVGANGRVSFTGIQVDGVGKVAFNYGSGNASGTQFYDIDVTQWHIYRITSTHTPGNPGDPLAVPPVPPVLAKSVSTLYIDENPVPVLTDSISGDTGGGNYLRFGDKSGSTFYRAYYDWIIYRIDDTWAPTGGTNEKAIPATLHQ